MTFEEFFKKKRIDLVALEQGEPSLFSEFKTHFEQMGEKSFDHSKKYWFNKLRRQFVLAPEIKTEKQPVANPLAEQTITESLSETINPPPVPKLGFVPKFKMGNAIKSPIGNEDKKEEVKPNPSPQAEEASSNTSVVKPAYQPRFKMKPKEETQETAPNSLLPAETPPADNSEPKPAYKPRFKMKPKEE